MLWLLGVIYQEKMRCNKIRSCHEFDLVYILVCEYMTDKKKNHTTPPIEAKILEQTVVLTLYNTPFVLPSDIQRLI